MHWHISHRADPFARVVADRHYNRQKIGTPQFVPPGRCMVLYAESRKYKQAFWVTSWPFAQYVKHAWGGAWISSAFRNEGVGLSSILIREAIACSRHTFGEPPSLGMVTFVNQKKVREKTDPGYCYLKAGFSVCGHTKGGLLALQMLPEDMPEAQPPHAYMPACLGDMNAKT
jgi:hypothetical protein